MRKFSPTAVKALMILAALAVAAAVYLLAMTPTVPTVAIPY